MTRWATSLDLHGLPDCVANRSISEELCWDRRGAPPKAVREGAGKVRFADPVNDQDPCSPGLPFRPICAQIQVLRASLFGARVLQCTRHLPPFPFQEPSLINRTAFLSLSFAFSICLAPRAGLAASDQIGLTVVVKNDVSQVEPK